MSAGKKGITVELRSKGPGIEGKSPIREMISSPIGHFPINSILAIREFQSMGKIKLVPGNPTKRSKAKFHCIFYLDQCMTSFIFRCNY